MASSKEVDQPNLSQLQQIISELTDGVVFIEADGTISWANDAALAMHGVDTPAKLGASIDTYRENFHLSYRGGRSVPASEYPLARLCRGEPFDDLVVEVRPARRPEPDWVHRNRGLYRPRCRK